MFVRDHQRMAAKGVLKARVAARVNDLLRFDEWARIDADAIRDVRVVGGDGRPIVEEVEFVHRDGSTWVAEVCSSAGSGVIDVNPRERRVRIVPLSEGGS